MSAEQKLLRLAEINGFKSSSSYGSKRTWSKNYYEPEIKISYYSSQNATVTFEILNEKDKILKSATINATKGLNFYNYTGTVSEKSLKHFDKENQPKKADNGSYYLSKGTYKVRLSTGKIETTKELVVE